MAAEFPSLCFRRHMKSARPQCAVCEPFAIVQRRLRSVSPFARSLRLRSDHILRLRSATPFAIGTISVCDRRVRGMQFATLIDATRDGPAGTCDCCEGAVGGCRCWLWSFHACRGRLCGPSAVGALWAPLGVCNHARAVGAGMELFFFLLSPCR